MERWRDGEMERGRVGEREGGGGVAQRERERECEGGERDEERELVDSSSTSRSLKTSNGNEQDRATCATDVIAKELQDELVSPSVDCNWDRVKRTSAVAAAVAEGGSVFQILHEGLLSLPEVEQLRDILDNVYGNKHLVQLCNFFNFRRRIDPEKREPPIFVGEFVILVRKLILHDHHRDDLRFFIWASASPRPRRLATSTTVQRLRAAEQELRLLRKRYEKCVSVHQSDKSKWRERGERWRKYGWGLKRELAHAAQLHDLVALGCEMNLEQLLGCDKNDLVLSLVQEKVVVSTENAATHDSKRALCLIESLCLDFAGWISESTTEKVAAARASVQRRQGGGTAVCDEVMQ